jgi:hypothetical protein
VVGVAEAVEDREDDAPDTHGAPEVGEGVGHALHLAAIVTHKEVPCRVAWNDARICVARASALPRNWFSSACQT